MGVINMRKTKLAAAVSVACSFGATQVNAQATPNIEEILVTGGISESLQAALTLKRESSGVVDAISAEDIGKFPDTNLAESLQRITGVSINRVNGEGSEVTIRGFGGDFNIVTLNGRRMPAADANPSFFGVSTLDSSGASRSFDFSNLASEGVQGLQVYKTARATVPSGGLGGTVNIQTIRPLQAGDRFSIGAKAVYDDGQEDIFSDESPITPELSAVGSWVNEAETFGVAAFGSFQDRNFTSRQGLQGPIVWQVPFDPNIPAFANADLVNAPGPNDLTGFPSMGVLSVSQNERERINGMVVLEFAPSDRLNIAVDGMWAQNDQDQTSAADLPFFVRQFDFVAFDGNPTVSLPNFISEPLVAGGGSDLTQAGKELPFRSADFKLRDKVYSFGLNVDFQINESLSVTLDAATSTAEAGGNHDSGALSEGFSIGGQAVAAQFVDFRREIPNAIQAIADGSPPTSTMVGGEQVNFPGGNANGVFEKTDLGSQWFTRTFSDQETEIDQIHLDFSYDNGGPVTANFGLGYEDMESTQTGLSAQDELGGWNTGFVGDIATLMGEDAIQSVCLRCQFDDHDDRLLSQEQLVSDFTAAGGTIAPGAQLRLVGQEAFFVNPLEAAEAFDGFLNGSGSVFDNANRSVTGTDNNTVAEEIFSVYSEAILDGELLNRPMEVVAGLRWERTDVSATSVQSIPLAFRWESDNDFATVFGPEEQTITQDHSYRSLLPSLDVAVDITDNLKARVSLSRSLARPQLGNMFLKTEAGTPTTATALGGTASGSRGNAALDPLESDNLDLSLEYYYGEGSAFTVAFFDKEVTNFVGNEQVTTNLFGLRDVSSGAPGTRSGDALAALEEGGYSATESNLFTMTTILANPDIFPGGADEFIDPSEPGGSDFQSSIATQFGVDPNANDPLLQFIVQQPNNQQNAGLQGWEWSWTHMFTDAFIGGALDGFGFQANFTKVSGDIGFDRSANPNTEDQFALTGLSDSWNIIGFYENERFSARVLLNYRDQFLADTNIGQRVPRFVDDHFQVDFSASYNFNDNLTFTLEGINMLEEPDVFRGRTDRQVESFREADRRLLLGARYSF